MRIGTLVILLLALGAALQASEATKKLYKLRMGDQVRVTVFQEDELSITARIDNEGMLQAPLLKPIALAGLSVEDAQRLVAKRFIEEEILRKPQVLIQVVEFSPMEISVLGEVRSPGKYAIPADTPVTLVEIIAKAGGFTDIANARQVRLTRTENKETKVIIVDVGRFIQGRNAKNEEPPIVQDGDIIHIPQNMF